MLCSLACEDFLVVCTVECDSCTFRRYNFERVLPTKHRVTSKHLNIVCLIQAYIVRYLIGNGVMYLSSAENRYFICESILIWYEMIGIKDTETAQQSLICIYFCPCISGEFIQFGK